jgi:hypothetical protein
MVSVAVHQIRRLTMEIARQITAFLENKPGRLANICSALGRAKVNIYALTVMDSKEHSVLRLVTDNIVRTKNALSALGTPFQETDVLIVDVDNRPGALARICERLAGDHVNIDYAYCSSGARNGRTRGIFKVSNMTKASHLLTNNHNMTSRQRQRPGRRPAFAR